MPTPGGRAPTAAVTETRKECARPAAPPLGNGPRRTTSPAAATADTPDADSPERLVRTVAERLGEELAAARAEHRRWLDALDGGGGGDAPDGHRPKLRRATRRAAERVACLEGVLEQLRKRGD